METYLALLRGINVGGRNKIKMADLRALIAQLGLQDVMTYIQSGNLLFRSEILSEEKLRRAIEQKIREVYQYEVKALVIPFSEWEHAYQNNPFLDAQDKALKFLHLSYLGEIPDKEKYQTLAQTVSGEDEIALGRRCIYLFAPGSYARSTFTNDYIEKKLGLRATTRNWRTVGKLVELGRKISA